MGEHLILNYRSGNFTKYELDYQLSLKLGDLIT